MTSKIRFLCDGIGGVYLKCYFSQLTITSSALPGLLNPDVVRETTHFEAHFGPHPPNPDHTIIVSYNSSNTYKKAIDLLINSIRFSIRL